MKRKYPAVVSATPVPALKRGTKRKRGEPCSKKKVSFASTALCRRAPGDDHIVDLQFEAGRECEDFARTSSYYEPGLHAAPEGSVWEDTSRSIFNAEFADLCNLEVYATDSNKDFDKALEEPGFRPGVLQGLVGSHPAHDQIIRYVNDRARMRVEDGSDGLKDLSAIIKHSDTFIALGSGDTLLEGFFARSPHVEEERDTDADAFDENR
ncbi:hypothetical protein CC86DRAFT_404689 [Ophiobolus disseminans]|uniref:Uncharacterized protein n=1 Tax=Ophiobolus disseminans TaxID=1469910 RepID=A0A6A7A6L1_9PLEO|nr:hypothetical protein CC86DRAFT_404689 [Ophiobolus disseminans]